MCFAVFDSVKIGEQIFLVLDREQDHNKMPLYFHPEQRYLIEQSQQGLLIHYVGSPIDIEEYLKLPQARRGFQLGSE